MRIGLLADCHGDPSLLSRCATYLVAQCGAERLYFLGGDYPALDEALAEMEAEGLPEPAVTRVPAKPGPEYEEGPRTEIEMLGSLLACLVHDKAELTRDEIANVTLIFHGNSAEAAMVRIGPRLFVTPGSLGGSQGTFGLLAVGPNAVQFVTYGSRDLVERKRDTARLDRRTNFRAG